MQITFPLFPDDTSPETASATIDTADIADVDTLGIITVVIMVDGTRYRTRVPPVLFGYVITEGRSGALPALSLCMDAPPKSPPFDPDAEV